VVIIQPQYEIRNLAICVNINLIFHYKHDIGTSSQLHYRRGVKGVCNDGRKLGS
jgi:hypothetical protein